MESRTKTFDLPLDLSTLFPERYQLLVDFTVPGNLQRKDNGRQIVWNKKTQKPMVIKSANALSYRNAFLKAVPESAVQKLGSESSPLALWANIFYQSNRSDVSVELLKDLLEKAGVISNDRWIKTHYIFGQIDRDTPRTELKLFRIL